MALTTRATALAAVFMFTHAAAQALDYPDTPKAPVTDTYHGVPVTEDYRWLERLDDPRTKAWLAAENRLSRDWLDAVPGRTALRDRLAQLMGSASNSYYGLVQRGGRLFAMKWQPPKQQPMLVTLGAVDGDLKERVVVDPNAMSSAGALAIDFFEPSLDGRRVAVSISENGSEDGSLHVFDVDSGRKHPEVVPRVAYPTGGGSVAWTRDGRGLYYTRYPAPGERPEADLHFYQQVWFHTLGTPVSQDRYESGRDFPRIAETVLDASSDGRHVSALVSNGDGGEHALYVKGPRGWRSVAGLADGIKAAHFGDDGWLYLLSRNGAPKGKIVRVALSRPVLATAQTVLGEGDGTIEHFAVAGHTLYVADLLGGPSRLRTVDLRDGKAQETALPAVSAVTQLARIGGDRMLAQVESYTQPPAWFRVSPGAAPVKTALAMTSAADYGDVEVVREFAVSKDGTRIPLNIVRRKGTVLDGNNPTLLYGYGGYSINMVPGFSASRRVWLDRGGVYVVANLRGGGEYGEAWHLAGNLTRKQTVFDDFIASAEYLVRQRYTQPERLAIMGGSNGGLLMGAALTQRPELFRAVSSSVGLYDMLRIELDPNGAFNVTEFGSVKDPAQFEALYAYSPLHRVKDGTAYPAVLFTTGDNDGRVNPMHSRKMAARLQAADPSGRPILLRTSAASGHGMGTRLSEAIEQMTDHYAFLLHELGVPIDRQP